MASDTDVLFSMEYCQFKVSCLEHRQKHREAELDRGTHARTHAERERARERDRDRERERERELGRKREGQREHEEMNSCLGSVQVLLVICGWQAPGTVFEP